MIFTAKTIEDALLNAEKETGKNRNNFIYTVQEKKVSIFGGKEYVINLQGFKEPGSIEIKDGTMIYQSGALNPSITPGENVVIKINDSYIFTKTAVKDSDIVTIEPLNVDSKREINLEISDDKLVCFIEVQYTPERKFQIIDSEPSSDVTVQAKCIDEKYPIPYLKHNVEDILTSNKIKYGIKWENIPTILAGGKHIIAQGRPPRKPKDDVINYLFEAKEEKKPIEINGKIDFLSVGEIESVEVGEVIATRVEGEDGQAGYDVYGTVILPEKRVINKFKKGTGCEIIDNGLRVIASLKGMVSLKNDTICVFPILNISNDIDIKSGNIQFDGDISIRGNVKEGLKVIAGNNVTIYGDVAEASISSGGNLRIDKNIISSTLNAGAKQLIDTRIIELIKSYDEFLNKFLNAYYEFTKLSKGAASSSVGAIFKVLLHSKFYNFKETITEGINFVTKNRIQEEAKNLWEDGVKLFRLIEDGELNDIRNVIVLNKCFNEYVEKYNIISTPADVIINYSQNSNIYATNNVEIKGKGCYNTNIIADNKVLFTGYPGILRGGQIYGDKGITAKEVGSTGGVITILKTSKEGIIEATVAYQNTIIFIGEQTYRIENPVKMLKAYISKGEIIVEKLKL